MTICVRNLRWQWPIATLLDHQVLIQTEASVLDEYNIIVAHGTVVVLTLPGA